MTRLVPSIDPRNPSVALKVPATFTPTVAIPDVATVTVPTPVGHVPVLAMVPVIFTPSSRRTALAAVDHRSATTAPSKALRILACSRFERGKGGQFI